MNFTTKEMIGDFRLVQTIMLFGKPIEQWNFHFGFVIPDTTNSWQCILEAAGGDQMIPAHVLSGNVTIETAFFDGDILVSKTHLKVYYVDK
jgi:retinal rod rhodopsin-sensitive cGMP 3',5'-cyclic phosphodiesterase subunit delta